MRGFQANWHGQTNSPLLLPNGTTPRVPRVDVLGVGIHAMDMDTAIREILDALDHRKKGYVCVTGVHGVMEAQDDLEFRRILNESFLTTPDGMPTVWVGRAQGHRSIARVYGPDLMAIVCASSVAKGYRHFLYGGVEGVGGALQARLEEAYPGIKVVGHYTPPFRPLDESEERDLIARISNLKPDVIWVGLSTPKQERFMAHYIDKLDTVLMFGVGAAFDIHTGRTKDSPQWMKKSGLQWLHRLIQEPRRLGKRYLVNNPAFLVRIAGQFAARRSYLRERQA
jgi:N-acetylglucosaminyldiphosphoundecaprenol N-acetyl-beta-D-mannosaminyltransferase